MLNHVINHASNVVNVMYYYRIWWLSKSAVANFNLDILSFKNNINHWSFWF